MVILSSSRFGSQRGANGLLERLGPSRILLLADDVSKCSHPTPEGRLTKNSSWLPVRMTLHPFHLRDAAFFPPSTRSSFRLSKPILVILRLETAPFSADGENVVILVAGARGAPSDAEDLLRGRAVIWRMGARAKAW